MKKLAIGLLTSSLAFGPALASEHIYMHMHRVKPVTQIQIGHNTSATPWIVGGMVGCASLGLLGYGAYTASTQHRELTCREANMIAFGCIIPFVGAYLVDAAWKADPTLEQKCHVQQ